jgi:hypothetical protein
MPASKVKMYESLQRMAGMKIEPNNQLIILGSINNIIALRSEMAKRMLRTTDEREAQNLTDLLNLYNRNLCEVLAIPEPTKIENQDL